MKTIRNLTRKPAFYHIASGTRYVKTSHESNGKTYKIELQMSESVKRADAMSEVNDFLLCALKAIEKGAVNKLAISNIPSLIHEKLQYSIYIDAVTPAEVDAVAAHVSRDEIIKLCGDWMCKFDGDYPDFMQINFNDEEVMVEAWDKKIVNANKELVGYDESILSCAGKGVNCVAWDKENTHIVVNFLNIA